jgi:hypothetical protein
MSGKSRGQPGDGFEVDRGILANRGVRATAGLDAEDSLLRQRRVLDEELRVFGGVDVVGHHAEAVLVAQGEAQGQGEGGLAGADRASDADAQGGTSLHLGLAFFHDRKSLEYCVSWRHEASARPGAKLLQRASGQCERLLHHSRDAAAECQQDALPGGLAERYRLQRRHHLVLAPRPQIAGQRIGRGDLPDRCGQRPADREGDFGQRIKAGGTGNRRGRAAGGAANSPSARSRRAARTTRGWPGSRR